MSRSLGWPEGSRAGHIHQLSLSAVGVSKLPVQEDRVTEAGVRGDRQRNRRLHGGPSQALCLFWLKLLRRLRVEGHPIHPGSTGENLTLRGLDWPRLVPGAQLQMGEEVRVEVASYTAPCRTIRHCFREEHFGRISQKLHPGESRLYARGLTGGSLRRGDRGLLL